MTQEDDSDMRRNYYSIEETRREARKRIGPARKIRFLGRKTSRDNRYEETVRAGFLEERLSEMKETKNNEEQFPKNMSFL